MSRAEFKKPTKREALRRSGQLCESSAAMSVQRSTSLIEYTIAWAMVHGIDLGERT